MHGKDNLIIYTKESLVKCRLCRFLSRGIISTDLQFFRSNGNYLYGTGINYYLCLGKLLGSSLPFGVGPSKYRSTTARSRGTSTTKSINQSISLLINHSISQSIN